jgi:hypothetical protein
MILVAVVVATFFFGGWFIAIPLSVIALAAGLGLRASGRVSESGELRRFRAQAGNAAPDRETLAEPK